MHAVKNNPTVIVDSILLAANGYHK